MEILQVILILVVGALLFAVYPLTLAVGVLLAVRARDPNVFFIALLWPPAPVIVCTLVSLAFASIFARD